MKEVRWQASIEGMTVAIDRRRLKAEYDGAARLDWSCGVVVVVVVRVVAAVVGCLH